MDVCVMTSLTNLQLEQLFSNSSETFSNLQFESKDKKR